MGRIPREDVAYPSAPDPRFGGNLARGTAGAQYPGASGDYYGGPSRGSPMLDRRYENYVAPRPADYTRNVPIQTGTPNFRPPYGAPGQPSYSEWRQQKDPFHTGPYPPKQHPNPRMRHINPRGMNQALSSLDSLTKKNRGLEEELSEIYKQQDRARMHPLFPSPGPWNEFDPVSSWANYDPNDPRAQAWENDQGGLESLQSKVNLMDLYDRLGGDINWSRLLRQMDQRGIEYSNRGGLMSLRR